MHERPPEVDVTEIEEGRVLERDHLLIHALDRRPERPAGRLSAFLVEHDSVQPAFGYRFDADGASLAISGDTRPSENLMRWSGVDLLVHLMPSSDPAALKAAAEKRYGGSVTIGEDLLTLCGTAADQFLALGATPASRR